VRRTDSYPSDCWLSPSVEVRPSPIEGLGLFARRPIAEGEVVSRIGGRVIDDAAMAALTPPYSSVCVDLGVHLLIDPAHPIRYGNHACDPNLWHVGSVTVVARRAISVGEELTLDYATHTLTETWSMPCRCGAANCRAAVTGADWKRADLRAAYGRHWTAGLLQRIDAG
jgi:hypothetical protein